MNRDETIRFCYQIPGQCWPTELGWLFDTFAESTSHLEVGVYCGRSLFATCGGMLPIAKVYAIDDDRADMGVSREWVQAVRKATLDIITPRVRLLPVSSLEAAHHLQGIRFDSIYIDGCHEYAECLADIQLWSRFVRPGGIIAGHDYWPIDTGVIEAVNEAFAGTHSTAADTRIWYKRM